MTDEQDGLAEPIRTQGSSPARQAMLYDANRKSVGVAYLLWLFLGGFGGHRFYLGRTGTGVALLALTLLGWATLIIGVGMAILFGVGAWIIVDAFLIPGMARDRNLRLADDITQG